MEKAYYESAIKCYGFFLPSLLEERKVQVKSPRFAEREDVYAFSPREEGCININLLLETQGGINLASEQKVCAECNRKECILEK